jgi:HEAT repeat protein
VRAVNLGLLPVAIIALLAAGSACRQADDVASLVATARNGHSVKVRQEACVQLAEAPGEAASEALIGFLGDDELWYCAAHGLGERKEPRAVEPLLEHLDPRSPHTYKFVWALGEIGDPSALQALHELRGRIDTATEEGRRIGKEVEEAVSKLRVASS